MRSRRALIAAAGATAAAVAARALWWEPRRVRLTRHDIGLPGWPPALDGLRVALIADLHAGAPHVDLRKLERVVARRGSARCRKPSRSSSCRITPTSSRRCRRGSR